MALMVFSFVAIFILVYSVYSFVTNLEVDKLETLLEAKVPVIALCILSTIVIITLIIINF